MTPVCPGKCAQLVRLILLTRGFDTGQDRQADQDHSAHHNPAWRNVQDDGAIDQPADDDQESDYVKAK